MPSPTINGSDDLMRAVLASERLLALQRNAERLVDDLDALVWVAIIREFPDAEPLVVSEGLVAEAKRRLAKEALA